MQQTSYQEEDIGSVAKMLIDLSSSKTLCFHGQMGAGKTTLIKALVKELGGGDIGNSPTFGIVNEYHDTNGQLLAFHFDFYRLEDETEALDLGFEDYLGHDVWIFIEWPEKISTLIPKDATILYLEVLDESTRKLVWE